MAMVFLDLILTLPITVHRAGSQLKMSNVFDKSWEPAVSVTVSVSLSVSLSVTLKANLYYAASAEHSRTSTANFYSYKEIATYLYSLAMAI